MLTDYEKKWGKGTHVAVDVVVTCKYKVLTGRRKDTYKLALPEATVQSARRELLEETGLDIDLPSKKSFVMDDPDRDSRSHTISVVQRFDLNSKDHFEIIMKALYG